MTLLSGNNTQQALISHSSCESEQQGPEVRDDSVVLGLKSKCLYPVVTGCKEVDWSHISHILTLITSLLALSLHLHLHLVSMSKRSTEDTGHSDGVMGGVGGFRRRKGRKPLL